MIIHKPSFVVDDETGATFPPTNAGGIYVANGAAFRVAGVDLAALYASSDNRYKLVAKDTALKKVEGWIDVADDAEALGNELEDNGSVWTGASGATPPTGWLVGSAGVHTIFDSGDGAPYNVCLKLAVNATPDVNPWTKDSITTVVGKLYKFQFRFKHGDGTSGQVYLGSSSGGGEYKQWNPTDASWATYTHYFVAATTTTHFYIRTMSIIADKYELFDEISFKEVTNVGTDGVLIMSTKGGSTQSWASQESGIDLNDIATFEVQRATRHHSL